MEICVIARAKAKTGKEKDLETALRQVVGPTRKESGCTSYVLQQGWDDPAFFQVNEIWQSREAWEAHLQTPHIKTLFSKVPELVVAPPEMIVFKNVN
jgi:quinol monooxygenase YgiN